MAYRDSDGKITIDEAAAQTDINRAARAAEILRQASNTLKTVVSETSSFQGETANAIVEKAQELQTRVQMMISNLEETQSYTRKVVAHYQEVDRKAKEIIEKAGSQK